MTVTIPIRYVRAAVALGSRQQWDVTEILRGARVSPMLLRNARSRVTIEQAAMLAQAVWRHTDDELLGLAPAPVPRGTFRLLSYALISAVDAEQALRRLPSFVAALPGVPPVSVEISESTTRLAIDTSTLDDQDGLLTDALLAVQHRFLGWLLRSKLPLNAVELPYPRPDDVSLYREIFGMVPIFDRPTAALVLDNTLLGAPMMHTTSELEDFVSSAPAGLLARREHGSTLVDRVRRFLERDPTIALTAEQVAARLAMAGPTLRRRLREEGTSYRQIREDLLRDTAIEALAHTHVTIAEVAERLGFSETSAFVRAFRRWTGMSPGAYRATVSERSQ